MMGRQRRDQGRLFYDFWLEDGIPENHLQRRMNVFVTVVLADLPRSLPPAINVSAPTRRSGETDHLAA